MKNSEKVKRMIGLATLSAIVAVLQLIANYIPSIGGVSITLALVPLIIGAILYGPLGGCLLGIIMGIIVLTAPSTGSFLAVNPFATVFLCLFKTAVAGLICGWIFKALRKKSFSAAIIVTSLACPMINTGIFAGGCMLFFLDTLKEWAGGSNVFSYLFLTMIGVNFLVEFAINSFLSPTIIYIVRILSQHFQIGSTVKE